MARLLVHRGPDGDGFHVDGPVGFGHRRLSVIDLSDAAAQPMTNEDGSLWLVYNGEIYNFRELRRALESSHAFRSQGDGEVILHLYEDRGEDAITELDGMFALALWDAKRRRLLLARDRTGKKPLFYYDSSRLFAFASEVKALLAYAGVPHQIDTRALPLFLAYGYVPTPGTLYAGIRSLPPGHLLVATEDSTGPARRYWQVHFEDGREEDHGKGPEHLREVLRKAVARRLVADVPLGAFLSGGIDSSAVVAFMAEQASGRVRTFSIGFSGGEEYNETAYARLVAERFETDHTEFIVEPQTIELIDRLVWHHDGAFGDSSAVPTYLLAELTRSRVTVALNGDGGDELFAGYLRLYGGVVSERIPPAVMCWLGRLLHLLPQPADRRNWLRFVQRFAEVAKLPLLERYLHWNGYFIDELADCFRPELDLRIDLNEILESFRATLQGDTTLTRLLNLNFMTYLPDDLLVKMDRMTMAHGLEARSPFLDTALIEFAARLSNRQRIRLGEGKQLLRGAMRGILPEPILRRKKMGFGAPFGTWFRGELQNFVGERLLDDKSSIYAYLRREPIEALLRRHFDGVADLSAQIWALLTLESWLRQERTVRQSAR